MGSSLIDLLKARRKEVGMSFRNWMEHLRGVKGNQPIWPWLLGQALDEEFVRQVEIKDQYEGEIFKNRDNFPIVEGESERRLVQNLFQSCWQKNKGCLNLGDEQIWLFGFEFPNQGGNKEKGRRADLVGMRADGGIVVFECKRADNTDPPFTAIVEGLDYLAAFSREGNFDNLLRGFNEWKEDKKIPEGFVEEPSIKQRPMIIVLAPEDYFKGRYTRSNRGMGWPEISEVGKEICECFQIVFATSDFKSFNSELL